MTARKLSRSERIAAAERTAIMDSLAPYHNPNGIDVKKSEHFIRALGWPVSNYLIVDTHRATRQALGNALEPKDFNNKGVYIPRVGLALVFDRGDANTATLDETFVHEQTHATMGVANRARSLHGLKEALRGRAIPGKSRSFDGREGGAFIEEGFASLVTTAYKGTVKDVKGPAKDPDYDFEHPAKHSEGNHYTYGNLALTTLCEYAPELTGQLFDARMHEEVGRDVVETINSIEPRLFDDLYAIRRTDHLSHDARNFQAGLDRVLRVGGHTTDDLADICERSPVQAYVDAKLAGYEQATGYSFQPTPSDQPTA